MKTKGVFQNLFIFYYMTIQSLSLREIEIYPTMIEIDVNVILTL